MNKPPANRGRAGGVWIALGALIGFALGVWQREPSAGVVIGTGVGVVAAIVTAMRRG